MPAERLSIMRITCGISPDVDKAKLECLIKSKIKLRVEGG